jgi:hypothetical protein
MSLGNMGERLGTQMKLKHTPVAMIDSETNANPAWHPGRQRHK